MPTDEHCADHSAHERAINVHDERLGLVEDIHNHLIGREGTD